MKDDELRAFLESATVGGEENEQQVEAPAASTIVLPPVPTEQANADRGLSFDDLIGQGMEGASADSARPIVLPGPSENPFGRSQSPRASAGLEATVPIVTPPIAPTIAPPSNLTPSETAPPVFGSAPLPPIQAPAQAPPANSQAETDMFPPTQPIAATPIVTATAVTAISPAAQAAPMSGAGSRPGEFSNSQTANSSSFDSGSDPDSDYEKISVTGGVSKSKQLMPWIIVAGGAVIALLAAFFIVTSLTSGGSDSNEAGTSTQTEDKTDQTTSPRSSGSTNTTAPGKSDPTPSTSTPATNVPAVAVGPTMNMPIAQWSTQVDLSQKLGDTYYQITGENLVLTSSLIQSMPASCAGTWGMTRSADGTFAVLKPHGNCTEAPELYAELWGLMDAMVKTARPI